MRVLITGAAGFLGSHLCDRFLADGHTVLGLDNFITGNPDNIAHLTGDARFEFVRHNISTYTYIAGDIDGAWVPEPWATRFIQEGGAHVLVDEADLWPDGEYVTTHLIVRTAFLEEHPDVVKGVIEGLAAAIDLWSACANYGEGFPRLVAGTDGNRVIRIEPVADVDGSRCGSFIASTIRLHATARSSGRLLPCTPIDRVLAHEIGHALGLADAPPLESCRDHIMAPAFHPRDAGRFVRPSECQAVGQHWLTPEEHDTQERLIIQWSGASAAEEVP